MQTHSIPAAFSLSSMGPAAEKTMGRCPAALSPMALSNVTLVSPPVSWPWSPTRTMVSGALESLMRTSVAGRAG